MTAFEELVYAMRRMQQHYFKNRDPLSLKAAKSYEKQVDAHIASLGKKIEQEKEEQQPKLF